YPFSDTVQFRISSSQSVRFPLYLRIPRWCSNASIRVNGKAAKTKIVPLHYVRLERTWSNGDTVTLRMPMQIQVQRWEKNNRAVSVDYGPLTFSLKIGERWSKYGGTDQWPEFEVYPTTDWNYGLVLNEKNPAKSFVITRKAAAISPQPFTPDSTPIELHAKAKK